MLKQLSNAPGVSGGEDGVRQLILHQLAHLSPIQTPIGNILMKQGTGKKLLLSAHMDEVGFIISQIKEDGFLGFKTVGPVETDILLGKKILIGPNSVPGIIGVKAIHLQEKDSPPIKIKDLYVDIGADSESSAQQLVSLGDYAVFDNQYDEFGDQLIKSKALSSRIGCYVLMDVLREQHQLEINACFTVMKELGARGAKTLEMDAHTAIILDTVESDDYDCHNYDYAECSQPFAVRLGYGVCIPFMDASAIYNRPLVDKIISIASQNGIPWQYTRTQPGNTDAGVISLMEQGVPTCLLSVAVRNLRSGVGIACKKDIEHLSKLVRLVIRSLI